MKFLALLLVACAWLTSVGAKAVFAHFMVRRDQSTDPKAHIDGFALNFAYGEKTNALSIPKVFSAANSRGFKIFFSLDYAGNGSWPQDEVTALINRYSSQPSYFFHEGSKPLVSTFEGPKAANDWYLIKEMTNCFSMPSWSSLGAKTALRIGVADGLSSWAAWPEGPNSMDTVIDSSYVEFLSGKPYMMPTSPWFYTNLPGYKKNWPWRRDNLWYDPWTNIFVMQPLYSHYIGPLNDDAYVAFDVGNAPFNYVQNMPHDGWKLFIPYFIDIRTPGSACAAGGTVGNTAAQLQLQMPASELAQDMVFISALVTKYRQLSVTIGGQRSLNSWNFIPPDSIGVFHAAVPFNGRTGDVKVGLLDNGNSELVINVASITGSCPDGIQNWNAWMKSSSQSISPTTLTKNVSELQCQKGWAKDSHNLLCPCTCSWLERGAGFSEDPICLKGYPVQV
ncbi:glycosyl hydrolase family 71 protein [Colletotrichum zoysiae]|uniref:Glycosyl hydrolase family 71 protein n=1 Tax=Colletotrichum zoysiae TaxID=1216348 RepID=A0AAD9H4R4_9PEZI|nr:glycosyl hydrolase family 71 protein [Colletotrichum zoysiae]